MSIQLPIEYVHPDYPEPIIIKQAVSKDDLVNVRQLFLQYAQELDVLLDFQDFEKELDTLPGKYCPRRHGILLIGLTEYSGQLVCCGALRKMELPKQSKKLLKYDENIKACEMKRLFINENFRNIGIGKFLANLLVEISKINYCYDVMVLDTLDRFIPACKLYRSLGFEEIGPYYINPKEGVVYYRKYLS